MYATYSPERAEPASSTAFSGKRGGVQGGGEPIRHRRNISVSITFAQALEKQNEKTFLLIFALAFRLLPRTLRRIRRSPETCVFSLEGGALYPLDDERDVVTAEINFSLLGFQYRLFENISGVVQLCVLPRRVIPWRFQACISSAARRSGFPFSRAKPISISAGFSCDWMRGRLFGRRKTPRSMIMKRNSAGMPVWVRLLSLHQNRAGVLAVWMQIWTEPDISDIVWSQYLV